MACCSGKAGCGGIVGGGGVAGGGGGDIVVDTRGTEGVERDDRKGEAGYESSCGDGSTEDDREGQQVGERKCMTNYTAIHFLLKFDIFNFFS
jgi:hypothetical protein